MFGVFGVGDAELLILAVVALLLFGSKLPSVMHSLGKSLSQLKRGMNDVRENVRKNIEESDSKGPDKPHAE